MNKKILIIVLSLLVVSLVLLIIFRNSIFKTKEKTMEYLINDTEENEFIVSNYSIFGTHYNINACTDKIITNKTYLVLKNLTEEIDMNGTFYNEDGKTCFKISDKYNTGIDLESLTHGEFILMVKEEESKEVKDKEPIITNYYYNLKNGTENKNLEYYTITRNGTNNKININYKNQEKIYKENKQKKKQTKNYLEFVVKESKLPNNVYDIAIDPGHGGIDPGAIYKLNGTTYYESNITLNISQLLKKELEDMGLKVIITRDDDSYLDPYGEGGRTTIVNSSSAKISLSIHMNSDYGIMKYGGVEIYTPNNIDYTLAKSLADNIAKIVGYSKKPSFKVSDGIYFKGFTTELIEEANKDNLSKGMLTYDIKEGAPYMFMIREIGGLNTYAYNDGRNAKYPKNEYYRAYQTPEPYLIETAYINYQNDLNLLLNSPDKFSEAISTVLKEYLNIS